MKRKLIFAALIISVLLLSCKNTDKAVNDEAFKRVYLKYKSGLIMNGAQKYIVKSGDTLVEISKTFYNDGFFYPVIMLASSDVVLDPDKIKPGMELTIVNLQLNLNDENARVSIKGVILDCAAIEDNRNRTDTAKGLRLHANTL